MVITDIPKLYTAIAEFIACMLYISLLPRRRSIRQSILISAGALALFCVYHSLSSGIGMYVWILYMIGAMLLMYLFIHIMTDDTRLDQAYCFVRAFVVAEFTASLHWQLYFWVYTVFLEDSPIPSSVVSFLSMLIIYGLIFLGIYLLEHKHFPADVRLAVTRKELISAVLTAAAAFIMSNLSFAYTNTPFSGISTSILYIRTLADFSGLLVLYSQQEHHDELRIREENMAINNILDYQYSQYQLVLENTERFRREYHDLKHYMIAIRNEPDAEKRSQYLTELEQAIDVQDAMSNTGNSTLDAILTAKHIDCLNHSITFTCMAEGELLSFLEVKSICSIFGNILDNAIEHVTGYPETDKRVIHLVVLKKNGFVMIDCGNYTENTLHLDPDELPQSTKRTHALHGYGLKSIRYEVEKYNGNMTIESKDQWYTIRILIPLPEQQ